MAVCREPEEEIIKKQTYVTEKEHREMDIVQNPRHFPNVFAFLEALIKQEEGERERERERARERK